MASVTVIIAHADWGTEPAKQWVAVARRDGLGRWTAFGPRRVGEYGALRDRLHLTSEDEPTIIGFDFPIGLPSSYAERVGVSTFPDFLWDVCRREGWRSFFSVADGIDEISLQRPFYPRTYLPKGAKRREHLEAALGVAFSDLLRRCDRRTRDRPDACPLFWTCGGNQVGKGALVGWRLMQAETRADVAIWPFDGSLRSLAGGARLVIAETYPAELAHHIGIGIGIGKRNRDVRRGHAAAMTRFARELGIALAPNLESQINDGFGTRAAGEDQFDAVIGLLGMLNVVEERRSSGDPTEDEAVQTVEGWMLGQSAT
jgi:hypothetical protein